MRTHYSSRRTQIRSLCLSPLGSIFGLHVAIAQTSGICRTVFARRVISGDRQINATSNCNVRRYASAQIIIGLLIITGLASQLSAQSYTIWPSTATPAIADGGPDKAVELGVKFRADVTGTITGVRFYKSATNTGTHTAHLWSGSGTSLATATFSGETASGWQQVNFTTPVAITANTVYVASYHSTSGHYSDDENYFSTGVDRAPLHALADGVSGVNGAYAYGSASKFPNLSFNSSNYWVDVVFTPSGGDTTAPTVTTFTIPSTANTLTVPISSFTATDNVGVTGYMVNESATTPSAAAAGWSATAPASYTFASAGSKTLYSWAKDAAGNISTSRSGSVVITILDTTAPTVTGFSIPGTSTSLTVAITTFTGDGQHRRDRVHGERIDNDSIGDRGGMVRLAPPAHIRSPQPEARRSTHGRRTPPGMFRPAGARPLQSRSIRPRLPSPDSAFQLPLHPLPFPSRVSPQPTISP